MTRRPWRERGLCYGTFDPRFFPEVGRPNGDVKAICVDCPVQAECADYATAHNLLGIWGGTTERQRRAIRRRRMRVA